MESQNYFELFGLSPSFRIDGELLKNNHRSLQALLHPDRHVNAGEREKRLIVEKASLVNEAYGILKDPCSRALYLLETQGIILDEEKAVMADSDFLVDMMQTEEAIQEACEQVSLQEADELLNKLLQRTQEIYMQFDNAWQQKQLDAALDIALKMKFLDRVYQRSYVLVQKLEEVK